MIVSRGTINGAFMGHDEAYKIIFIFLLTLDVECGNIKTWTGNTTNQIQEVTIVYTVRTAKNPAFARTDFEGGEKVNINKNDVLTFLAAVASIINLMIQWMS